MPVGFRKKKAAPTSMPVKVSPVELQLSGNGLQVNNAGASANYSGNVIQLRVYAPANVFTLERSSRTWRIDPAKLSLLIQLHGEEVK